MQPIIVTTSESGQKFLQFLVRRLHIPKSVLHKWIRTGQTRINGKRAHPFTTLMVNDTIRIPPFVQQNLTTHSHVKHTSKLDTLLLPKIIAESPELIVFCKPSGLPVHGGTNHIDSLAYRLSLHYINSPFRPTPIHRLDKDTSGVLLVAKTYSSLRQFSDIFASHNQELKKEYLAWVRGNCPWSTPRYLEDLITKQKIQNRELVIPIQQPIPVKNSVIKKAVLIVYCLKQSNGYSLLHLRLYTGRTHQIRAQLSCRTFPIVGDKKYGDISNNYGLKLHAFRISFRQHTYTVLPSWTGQWKITKNDLLKSKAI